MSRFLGFTDTSTAASSTITNDGWTWFGVNATAGSATIQNNLYLDFYGDATAGHATITNNGYAIEFHQNSTAGFATLNEAEFHESSTAGSATISGNIKFKNTSTAGSATLYSARSQIIFENSSSAGSATINNGNDVIFEANSTGGTARIINGGGARIRIYDHTGAVTLGSIEGAGSLMLGANTAQIGGNNLSTTFSGLIQDTGGLTKVGTGTLTLTGANTYSGGTTVSAGTLVVNNTTGSGTGSGAVAVSSGATLSGTGTIGALTIASGATLAPGNSPGTLNAGNTTFASGGAFEFEVNDATGSAGTAYDLLAISGSLTIGATSGNPFTLEVVSLTLANAAGLATNFNSAADYSFTFVTTTGGITGFSADKFSIDTTGFTNPFSGTWAVAQTNGGNDLALTYTGASAIPEPSTYAAIFGACALALAAWRRRRRSA